MPVRGTDIRTDIREAAHSLMEKGRPVLLISGDKIPYRNCNDCRGQTDAAHREVCACLQNGGLCHGFYAATTNPDVLEKWLEDKPETTMIAVRTGSASGVFVMEYDSKNGGDVSYNDLITRHGAIATETNRSPSGGLHHVFTMPHFEFGCIIGKLWPGIDIKANDGYALVPPSYNEGKGSYTVVNSVNPVPAPDWLLDKIFEYQSRNKWDSTARILRHQEQREYNPDSITPEQAEHVKKTLAYWQSRIRHAPDGTQNILIYTGSRALFSLCFHGLLDEEDAQAHLEDSCQEGNHPKHRSLLAIESGRRAAEEFPDDIDNALSNDINTLETFSLDDFGNANRVIFWNGTDVRYDCDRERFYTWAGQKWVVAKEGRVRSIVEGVHARISATEAEFYSNSNFPPSEAGKKSPKTYQEIFKTWSKTQRYGHKVAATIGVLTGRESIRCVTDDFDVDPYHLNVGNGVVDLRTGELLEHDRSFMCSSISDKVKYDPKAKCPEWERFLKMTQPNREHRRYLQRLMGYTLIGEVIDQIFAVHMGGGGNGKGVFLDTIAFVMGEYARVGQRDSFVRKSNANRIPADIAAMEGKRMIFVDELNANQKLDDALLKDVTGGGTISAEAKNVNPWEYTPKFTLHFRTNHMPDLPSDQSMIRRFRPVQWPVKPTDEEWNSFTTAHHSTATNYLTRSEASGILNWLVEGTLDYLRNGLQVPEDLQVEAASMLEENDPFLIFMNSVAVENTGAETDGSKLSKAFGEWYTEQRFSGNPPSSTSLYKDCRAGKYSHGYWRLEKDARNRNFFVNVTLPLQMG